MKSKTSKHLLAVDPSLSVSGWALFCLSDGRPKAVGIISPPGPKTILSRRFDYLQAAVTEVIRRLKLGAGDVLICEGPAPLVKNPQSALKVEGVRGIFESVARNFGVAVPGRLNPRTVQSEILGMRGKQLGRKTVKEWARTTALQLYGAELEKIIGEENRRAKISQDIIDAVLIGSLATSRVQFAIRSGQSIDSAFVGMSAKRGWGRGSGWTEAEVKKRFGEC